MDDPIRFTDILTTSVSVAEAQGAAEVTLAHVDLAVALLRGEQSPEGVGIRGMPFGRGGRGGPVVGPAIRGVVQAWFHRLGSDVSATISSADMDAFIADLRSVVETGDREDI